MPTLHVSAFSCLAEATFDLAPVNVIIGPQGSGKSITTKLFYFFSDILTGYLQSAERGDSIQDYKKTLARQFGVWFPPSAWGAGRFNLNYSAGSFSVRILRRMSYGAPSDEVSLTFSEWFSEHYSFAVDAFSRAKGKVELIEERSGLLNADLDRVWRVRESLSKTVNAELGDDYIAQQTFIPAGRAFFTSIGRLVAGFEHAGALDPVTVKFARLFGNLRERNMMRHISSVSRLGAEYIDRRATFMEKLFGGEVKFEDEYEFVETTDGRKVPFSSLSSGQQELLPMWSLIDYFGQIDAMRDSRSTNTKRPRELVYIEEPEAHLFPSAQSLLMDFLIGSIVSERNRRSLVITTHSPYIMSKLNVFLKAGQLARRKKRNQLVNEVVARDCWLNDTQLSAIAIENGYTRDLIDKDDGLIDSTYLDDISEEISRQFSALLRIESEL